MKNSGFYPAAAPQVKDGAITVDLMLQEPTRLTRYVADITRFKMFTDRLFSPGEAKGGALLYDVALANTALADDHMGIIAPGASHPVIDVSDGEPKITRVVKLGGKYGITDEAKDRNDMASLQRKATRVANQMVFDLDAMGITAVKDAFTSYDSDTIKVQSEGWASINKTAKSAATAAKSIRADINKAKVEGEKSLMGYVYNLLILHSDDYLEFTNSFETNEAQEKYLGSEGIEVISSPLATKGEGILAAEKQVGTIGIEKAMSTSTWYDEDKETTWAKTNARMVYAVTDPLAMIRLQNIGS